MDPLYQQNKPVIISNISPLPPRSALPQQYSNQEQQYQHQQHQQQQQQYNLQQSQYRPQPLPPPPSTSAWNSPPLGQSRPLSRESSRDSNNNSINSRNNSIISNNNNNVRSGLTPRSPQTFSQQQQYQEPYSTISNSPERSNNSSESKGPPQESFVRIKIIGLEKNRKDVYLKFNAESNISTYRKSIYRGISRSYTEFTKLVDALSTTAPQSIVPALPLAQISAGSDEEEERIVKLNFQKWFARVTNDKDLMKDDELRSFIESEFGYSPNPHNKRRLPPTFHMPRGPKLPDEQDDSLTLSKASMSRLESNFLEASKAVITTARSRRQVALAMTEVGDRLNDFSTTENYLPLAQGIKKLARVTKVRAELLASQASGEQITLGDVLEYQSRNAKAAKDTLASRDMILDQHRTAAKSAISKRKAIEKLKGSSSIRSDKVDDALEELADALKEESLLSTRLTLMSESLLPSLQTHSLQTHSDLFSSLLSHAKTNLQYEKLILKELELVKPELHAIKRPEVGVVYYAEGLVGRDKGRGSLVSRGMVVGDREEEERRRGSEVSNASSSHSNYSSTSQQQQQYQPQNQHSRTGSIQSYDSDSTRRFSGNGTQSMYSPSASTRNSLSSSVGGGNSRNNSQDLSASSPSLIGSGGGRSISSMAKNVVVQGEGRQRVDAKMAASMLSGF